jgi:phenylpyruvate tautomerase PptA (4-oxalocrotonate tautomerase family)
VREWRKRGMPTIIVEADEGRTVEQKRGLVKDITEGKKENRGKAGKLAID